jgi:curved DNA-binding protein CbpA
MTRTEAASVLGVPPDAEPAEVQHAFLRLARHVHPDTLPDADDRERQAAALRFDRLLQARGVLLTAPEPAEPGPVFEADRLTTDPGGPQWRRVPGRGLGGSLVVLALLAFLLVALVSLDDAFRSQPFQPGSSTTPATGSP